MKSIIIQFGLYRQSIHHPSLKPDALTKNFNYIICGRAARQDFLRIGHIFSSLRLLRYVLFWLCQTGGKVLFGTSTENYLGFMKSAGAGCDMPHISKR